jgi:hypothetical protein
MSDQYTPAEFNRMAKELLDAAPTLDVDGLDNGIKCLGIAILNIDGSDNDLYLAGIVHRATIQRISEIAPAFRELAEQSPVFHSFTM